MRQLLLPLLLLLMAPVAHASDPLRFGAGLNLGATLPLSALGVGAYPRADFSAILPVAKGRLRPVLSVGWTQMGASGEGTDARVGEGSYDWKLHEALLPIGLGLTVRPLHPKYMVQPEITVQPEWVWMATTSTGTADGADFGLTREHYAAFGLYAAAGAATKLGPGEVVGALAFSTAPLKGQLTGDGSVSALTPSLGYRYWF